MTVEFNRTIVQAIDKQASATFLAAILGVPVQAQRGSFVPVQLANGVILDFVDNPEVSPQHYAFFLGEDEFDAAYGRLLDRRERIWADTNRTRPSEINHDHGGRGLYFESPDGHVLEILTQPYGPS